MALASSQFKVSLNWVSAESAGSSTLTGKTVKEIVQSFVDGAGAGAADDVVEATVQNNNTPVAFSSFTTQKGAAISAQTKIKAILIVNEGAAATTVTSSVSGLPVGALGAATSTVIPFIAANNATAGGWTCSSSSTFTSNGTSGQYIRVFMLLS